jgi:hypothetical protein
VRIFFGPGTPHGKRGQVRRTWGTRPFPKRLLEAWGSGRRGGGLYCWSADANANTAGVLLGS